ncbi:hypothetical protein [Phaeacidiphilus oryzae]|uniref:hypothetical protein n=1 Tax=Phaeacidiphilus oryzae TaxID=348818 RepID=UPI0005601B1D|nr:hypothetical protein [Phaeacidiphilus oryzae]
MRVATRVPVALPALFSAGYLAAYLLPTLTGRLAADFHLTTTQSGASGSLLLLGSASAGLLLAARGGTLGTVLGRRRRPIGAIGTARLGLVLVALGFGLVAALPGSGSGADRGGWLTAAALLGCVLGGVGSGTAVAIAGVRTAGSGDPHRASVLGLLTTCGLAATLYVALPRIPGGHHTAFAAVALWALAVLPLTTRLASVPGNTIPVTVPARHPAPDSRLPHRIWGGVLTGAMLCWSLAQNALWGVSDRIGGERAGLDDAQLGLVFAVALLAGLIGVVAAAAIGPRLGHAAPVGVGTAVIAGSVLLTATARGADTFTVGEVLWNAVYPAVLSYLMGLAASFDARGRWAVLVGSASSLGTACGPLAGTTLAAAAGFPGMGAALAALLLVLAAPLALTATRVHASTTFTLVSLSDTPTPAPELAPQDTTEAC